MIKRIVAILLGIVILVTSCPEIAYAAEVNPEMVRKKKHKEIEKYIDDIISGRVEVPNDEETPFEEEPVEEETEEGTEEVKEESSEEPSIEVQEMPSEIPTENPTVEEAVDTPKIEETTEVPSESPSIPKTENPNEDFVEIPSEEPTEVPAEISTEESEDELLPEEEKKHEEVILADDFAKISADAVDENGNPTQYDVFMAEYWIKDWTFNTLLKADGTNPEVGGMPYRSTVDELAKDMDFQTRLAVWETTMFVASDNGSEKVLERNEMYQKVIYSILQQYLNRQTADIESREINLRLDTTIELAQFAQTKYDTYLEDCFRDIDFDNIDDWTDEEYDSVISFLNEMIDTKKVGKALSSAEDMLEVLSFCEDISELIEKISMVETLYNCSEELADILIAMQTYTVDPNMDLALNQMAYYCSNVVSVDCVIAIFAGDMAVEGIANMALEAARTGLKSNPYIAAAMTTAEWTNEAFDIVFSHDAMLEAYYCMKIVREFENALYWTSNNYKKSFLGASSNVSKKKYSEPYNITAFLQIYTMQTGLNYAHNLQRVLCTEGLYNMFSKKKKERFEEYTQATKLVSDKLDMLVYYAELTADDQYKEYLKEKKKNEQDAIVSRLLDDYNSEKPEYTGNIETDKEYIQEYLETYLSLNVTSGYIMTKDMDIVGDVTITGGTLDLNGYSLTLEGDVNILGGSLNVNGGTLNVGGNFYMGSKGEIDEAAGCRLSTSTGLLLMETEGSTINVAGDFEVCNNYSSSLTNGQIRIKGNFAQYGTNSKNVGLESKYADASNFRPSGEHEVVLCGETQQSIYFESTSSKFNRIRFENPNVKLLSEIAGFILYDNVNFDLTEINDTLAVDGNLDLNGKRLTVNNSFDFAKGMLNINGGTLDVKGNFIIGKRGEIDEETGYRLATSEAQISLYTKAETVSTINVEGDYEVCSNKSMRFSNGLINVGGNFLQYGTHGGAYNEKFANNQNFCAYQYGETGNTLVFTGDHPHSIYTEGNSSFNIVRFENPKVKILGFMPGINLYDDLELDLSLVDNTLSIQGGQALSLNGKTLTVNGDVNLKGTLNIQGGNLNYSDDFNIVNATVNLGGEVCTFDGNLRLKEGSINLAGGHLIVNKDFEIAGGSLDLANSELTVNQNLNLTGGKLLINNGTLNANGNFSIGTVGEIDEETGYRLATSSGELHMSKEEGTINVEGDFEVCSNISSFIYLEDGVINLKGDFAQYGTYSGNDSKYAYADNFKVEYDQFESEPYAVKGHKVVLCGEEPQRIFFEGGWSSGFNVLELKQKRSAYTFEPDYINCHVLVNHKSFLVTYELDGGTNSEHNLNEYEISDKAIVLEDPIKPGYVFDGWYSESWYENKVAIIEPNNKKDIKLFAKWIEGESEPQYTITYKYISTKSPDGIPQNSYTQEVFADYYDFILPIIEPISGYSFNWYKEKDCKNKIYSIDASNTKNITVYGKWSSTNYYVVFDANGGVGSMKNQKMAYAKNTALRENTYKRAGYTFNGWNTMPNGTGVAYANEQKVNKLVDVADGSIILYAQWKPIKYKITYKNITSKMTNENPKTYTVESDVVLKEPIRTGYTFGGWYTDSKCKKPITVIDGTRKKAITVYAKWIANKYSIIFDGNGADNDDYVMPTLLCTYDKEKVLGNNVYVKKGYTFAGWNTAADGSGKFYKNKAGVKNAGTEDGEEVTLYAQWKVIKYKITYKNITTKMTNPNPKTYTIEGDVVLTAPIRTGYTFGGWYTDSKYQKPITVIEGNRMKAITLYAKWTANKYTISFDGNGADNADDVTMATLSCVYGKEKVLKKNPYVKKGYSFIGWNTAADGSGKAYKNKAAVKDAGTKEGEEVTLYAQWKVIKYKITYKNIDTKMTNTNPKTYTIEKDVVLVEPVRKGYMFVGWYTDSQYKKPSEVILGDTCRNITLYAKWKKK